jgi:geranylgeranyl reductase
MCDDKDVQRLTFDSYLYKRVVMMNPWQQLKLTLLTLGSVLRGNALAPQGYTPVDSAVRDEAEVNAMLAVSTIKGGIKVRAKQSMPAGSADQGREPVLMGKG